MGPNCGMVAREPGMLSGDIGRPKEVKGSSNKRSLACFLQSPTRFLFFTGKGGVGKTYLTCASAVALADRGLRVLLVSTDPASTMDEVRGVTLGPEARAVPGVPRLSALTIAPEAAAQDYRERLVGPYRGK